MKFKYNGKDPSNLEVFAIVCDEIYNIWTTASIPIVSKKRIIQLLQENYFEKYLKLKRYPKRKRNDSFDNKLKCFLESSKKLFDVAACKCTSFESCSCIKHKKVPVNERSFLLDQRNYRKMVISGVDKKETDKLMKRHQRQIKESIRAARNPNSIQETGPVESNCDGGLTRESSPDSDLITEASQTNIPARVTPSTSTTTNRNTLSLPTVGKICDRYGISSRSAAAIASAVLTDIGFVASDDLSLVVDKNKIRRARSKARVETSKDVSNIIVKSIYFDGRKDKTLVNQKIGDRYHRKEISVEHVSILAEPGSIYLGHVTPDRSTAKGIVASITTLLE